MSDPAISPVDRLLAYAPFLESTEAEDLYLQALKEEMLFHASANAYYGAYLRKKQFDPADLSNIEEIPYLPVQIFKAASDLTTVDKRDISFSLSSSATSGIPSIVPIDKITARRQSKCMAKVMADFIGNKRVPFLVLDVDPAASRKTGSYGARGAAVRAYLTFASKASYFMEETREGLNFLSEKFAEEIASLKDPVILFGFTYVLYSAVAQAAMSSGKSFHLPAGSSILHIGGWKKLAAANISKKQFSENLKEVFNVPAERQIDVYGLTEHMGLNYPDCPCGCKHTPHLSRVLIRDPETHAVLSAGKPGLLEFISPLPHSYPGCAVLTDDIGVIESGECPYGRAGTRFKIIGRQPKAEARGCGDIMGEKMRRPMAASSDISKPQSLRIWNFEGKAETLSDAINLVRAGQAWLLQQPLDAIIGLIDKVSSTWMDNPLLAHWKYKGLSFLSRWCSEVNLLALANQALRGLASSLDCFTPEPHRPSHLLRALPVGIAGHWLSGNVPLLAMLVVVQSIITKNGNILKTASNNFDALRTLLETFAGVSHTTSEGYTIKGDDLLRSMALVHYPHGDLGSGQELSMNIDARIAWGGRQAVEAICALPTKSDAVDMIFGPKTSFMVIAREAISDEHAVNKLLRRAATDISSFDQAACSSPHTIFIEKDAFISPHEFASRLGGALDRSLTLIPKDKVDDATAAAIQTARVMGDFYGECWHDDGNNWTVILDDRKELAKPVYSRTITVRPVDDIMDVVPLVNDQIQTIGLAAEGSKRLLFAERASHLGALRFPEIGSMTGFDSPWDGVFVIDRLVKWISLGGAASAIARNSEKGVKIA